MFNKFAFICSKIKSNGNITAYYYKITVFHLNILENVHYSCDDIQQCDIILQKSSKICSFGAEETFLISMFLLGNS